MEPTDLTLKILQEIGDENRGIRARSPGVHGRHDRIGGLRAKSAAEQMVMPLANIKTALELWARVTRRLDGDEQRRRAIERREAH